jgi:cytoskeleton protein RodZ
MIGGLDPALSTTMTEPRRQNLRQKPWEGGLESESGSFGSWLRRQREVREITLREISDTSKIGLRYLEALEQDRFEILPAPVFAKGFLRQYAKYVGLDPDEVVNYYLAAQRADEPEEEEHQQAARVQSSGHWTYGLFLTVGVVILFGVVAVLSFYAERRQRRDEPPPMAAPPVALESVPDVSGVEPEIAVPLRVTLDFTQNCLVEALIDGERRLEEHKVQGESRRIDAFSSVALSLSNVRGVSVEVNGRPYRVAADDGEVFVIELGSETESGN